MRHIHSRFLCFSLAISAAATALAALSLSGCSRQAANPARVDLPVEYALVTSAPTVPAPIVRRDAAHVIVDLEVREVVKHLSDGVDYTFWTFDGGVPGPFIRVREGDLVEIRLHNHPTSKLPHNIDLHAVSGPGGGAASTLTAPGHTSVFSFTALNPGLFAYHCAAAPVPMHVGSGMYGLILVEPKHGLPAVDHEYYVMQGEFYTAGRYGEEGLQAFDPQKADDERPSYVVFNGAVGALVGDNALPAKVNETVRIYFGDGGPNLVSSFHVIGTIFDKVYGEGGTDVTQHNVQTTIVPPGGAAIVEFHTRVPGNLVLVDHSLSRAFGKGALGMVKVTGKADPVVYSGKTADEIYPGTAGEVIAATSVRHGPAPVVVDEFAAYHGPLTKEIQVARGRRVFGNSCFVCHQADGRGIPGVFPPLAGSDILKGDKRRIAAIPAKGLTGPITVNGKTYNSMMPPQPFSDQQIADALTYVLNSWGNGGGVVSAEDVKAARAGPLWLSQ